MEYHTNCSSATFYLLPSYIYLLILFISYIFPMEFWIIICTKLFRKIILWCTWAFSLYWFIQHILQTFKCTLVIVAFTLVVLVCIDFTRVIKHLIGYDREKKKLLIEEGSIMASLNHERVVKLLGVIMEDRDCSLVMELIPRGNLLVMLETVSRFSI